MKRNTKVGIAGGVVAAILGAALLIPTPEEPLPLYAYAGETILGYDVPPKLYVIVQQHAENDRIRLASPECKQYWFNFPCHVVVPRGEETVRLHVFPCVEMDATPKFDQQSCVSQRKYNESFPK